MSTLKKVPEKKITICEACGNPLEYFLRDDWERFAASPVSELLCFDDIPHQQCEKEIELIESRASRERRKEEIEFAARNRYLNWSSLKRLPSDYRDKNFASYVPSEENTETLRLMKMHGSFDNFGIVLIGPSGTGKTHLLLSLMNREIEEINNKQELSLSYPVYFNASEFLAHCRKNDFDIPGEVTMGKFLILDDLGSENITEWSREILYRVFESRIKNGNLKTYVSTNLSLNELKDRLHERTTSRLLELCVPVQLKGNDMRVERMKNNVKTFFFRQEEQK